jgi:hypothetical protein
VAQSVARSVRDAEVGGSSPLTPTRIYITAICGGFLLIGGDHIRWWIFSGFLISFTSSRAAFVVIYTAFERIVSGVTDYS